MKTAEIISRPFTAEIGDGFCDKPSDVHYCDSLDQELVARCSAWQDAERVRRLRQPATVHFHIMAAALQRGRR